MADFDDILDDLKQKRDELRVQMHLASKEAQDEWEELEGKMKDLSRRAQLEQTGDGVSDALGKLGHELKLGYKRLRDAIKKD
jgi:vacuolar-type H+-ATPase subunit D/Vma8